MATNDTEIKKEEIVYIESTKHHFAMESQRSSLPPSHTTSMNTTFVKEKERKNSVALEQLNNSQDENKQLIKEFGEKSDELVDEFQVKMMKVKKIRVAS